MKQIFTFLIAIVLTASIHAQSGFYGMTYSGGNSGIGTIFKTDNSGNNQSVLYSFSFNEGRSPKGSLIQASNGKLYGMTTFDEQSNKGVLFEYDPATGLYTKKIDFDGINKGRNPEGSLIQASNGKLYGMTSSGGQSNKGVLFEYDPATNTFIKKIDFDGTNKGSSPRSS